MVDEENYNEKTYTTIMGIGSSSNTNNSNMSGVNKLSYRNLIFGTGRKNNRPYTDRARLEDSLFAVTTEAGGCSLLFADCDAYKSKKNDEVMKHRKGGRIFHILRKTQFWQVMKENERIGQEV